MTQSKHLKARVRARMAKTGESYTAARAQITKDVPPTIVTDWIRPVADERIVEHTGKSYDEWLAVLDERRSWTQTHTEIARHLQTDLAVPHWYAQTVTLAYERARGMRAVHEQRTGFRVTVSKTYDEPVEAVFERMHALATAHADAIRTATAPKRARYDWTPGRVHIEVVPKAELKTLVAVNHERLESLEQVEELRAFWKASLG